MELDGVYKKIESLKEDGDLLREEIERIGEPGLVIELPWWAHWRLRGWALKDLAYKKKQIVLAQEQREEFEATLWGVEKDLRAAEVLRDGLEAEVYPPKTVEELRRGREEEVRLKEVAAPIEKTKVLAETSGETKKETSPEKKEPEPGKRLVDVFGKEIITTEKQELSGWRVGDRVKIRDEHKNNKEIHLKTRSAKDIVIVGFTKDNEVIRDLDNSGIVSRSDIKEHEKLFEKIASVEGFQTNRDWVKSQIPETVQAQVEATAEKSASVKEGALTEKEETPAEKPPEKLKWISGEDFEAFPLMSGMEMLDGYQVGDRLRVRPGVEVWPETKAAKSIKVFGFSERDGKKTVVLIYDDRFLAHNRPKTTSELFEFIGR